MGKSFIFAHTSAHLLRKTANPPITPFSTTPSAAHASDSSPPKSQQTAANPTFRPKNLSRFTKPPNICSFQSLENHHRTTNLRIVSANHYNTIVIGVGTMGAASCYYLAKQGQRVLGIEQFTTPHERGSHGGQSRIIRKAYFEHPDYVPLLERAYKNWHDLERTTGTQFYHRTGILYLGRPDGENIEGIRRSASIHNIHIEEWNRDKALRLYKPFEIPDDFDIIFEPDAGFVTPESTIEAYVQESEKLGATILTNTPVLKWKQEGSKLRLITTRADYTADKLIITAGAWTSRMIPGLSARLKVTRQLLAWVVPKNPALFSSDHFPCWLVEDPALGTFYGFPLLGRTTGPIGLKLAHHHPGTPCGPDEINGPMSSADEEILRLFLRRYLPSAGEQVIHKKHCLYTYSPDSHFIVDHLPGYEGKVFVACGFSGHGFKFTPVIGEVMADLAIKGKSELPIEFLGVKRFG